MRENIYIMKIKIKSQDCIGCGACAAISPKVFEMKEDGHSHLIDPKTIEDDVEIKELDGSEEGVEEAVNGCPAQIISTEN